MRPSRAVLAARAASRANGARSRGPVTEEGKRRSSLNAIRHGLLSKNIVLQNESSDTFEQNLAHHHAKLEPADDVEAESIEEMVGAAWRLRRLWTIETRLLDNAISKRQDPDERDRLAGGFCDLMSQNNLHLLQRYESKLHRMYQRSLNNLLVLREFGAQRNYQTNLDSDKPC